MSERLYRLAAGGPGRSGSGRRRCLLMVWINPTAMHAPVKCIRLLGIYGTATDDAAESRLNMPGRTAEAIVQVEVAEGRIEIVLPHQADDPPAQPDAFGVGCGSAQQLGGFRQLVELALAVLLGVCVAACRPRGGFGVTALSQNRGRCRQQKDRAQGGGGDTHTGKNHDRSMSLAE